MRRLTLLSSFGLVLFASASAEAQQPPTFYAFDGTTRQRAAIEAGLTNAQVYGAVAAVDKVLMPHGYFDRSRFGNEFFWLRNVTQVPGCLGLNCTRGYKLQTIDLSSGNVAASWCNTDDEDENQFCAFYASAITATIAAAEGERTEDNLFAAIAGRGLGMVAPLMLVGGGTTLRDGIGAAYISAIVGVNANTDYISGRVGYLGAPGDRGLYADVSVDEVRAFATSAIMDEFKQLSVLMGGVRKLELGEDIGLLSTYVRSIRQVPSQGLNQDYELPEPSEQLGAYNLVTAHVNPTRIGGYVDLDAAYTIHPVPQLYNLLASVNVEYVDVGAGIVRLPAIPSLGIEEKNYIHFHVGGGAETERLSAKVKFFVNDAETLRWFPMARNSWGAYYLFSIGLRDD